LFKDNLAKLNPSQVGHSLFVIAIVAIVYSLSAQLILTASTGTILILQGAALPILLKYSPFLLVIWVVLRFGQQKTMLCLLITALSSIWGLIQTQQGDFQASRFQIQIAIAMMAMITLILVATIAERQRVEAQLRRRIEQDQFLAESTLRIRQSLDVKQVLNTTVAEVRAYLNADRAHIAVFDEQGFTEVVAESVAPGWNPMLGTRSPRPVLADVAALFEQQSVRVNPNSDMTQNEFLKLYYALYQVRASIGIAIWQEGQLYGVLNVHQCSAPRKWQDFEIELLTRLATQVELAIQQGRLYERVQGCASGLESQVQERTAQLQQKMVELATLNQAKDTLVHAVSHDLRTPVLGMLMVLKRLQAKADETISLSKSVLDRMVESGDRQLNLISSLLEDYSQEPQKLILNYQPVAIAELVEQTLHGLEPLIHQNRIRLDKQIAPDLPKFLADSLQLQRVLEHLITNAVKHNPPGINLAIQVEKIENEMKCTISDDGIGISPDQRNLLFDKPFLRGSQNRHRTGLGLGLFLCKQVITAHQGQLGVNCGGKGASFWFTLPLG
jgi:signal transduction histidine kinase